MLFVRYWLLLFLLYSAVWSVTAQPSGERFDAQISDTLLAKPAPAKKKKITTSSKPRLTTKNGSVLFLGLGMFLLFGLLRFFYGKHVQELINVLSKSTLGRMTSKDSLWHHWTPRIYFIFVYFFTAGYIVGRNLVFFTKPDWSAWEAWLWGTLVVVGISLLKWFSIHSVSLVFSFGKKAVLFFNHLSVVNQLVGYILLPVCGVILLLPSFLSNIVLFVSLFVLLISLIFKALINLAYVRTLPRVSFLHFILYLCTLEIIPLAVCARYVYNSMGV